MKDILEKTNKGEELSERQHDHCIVLERMGFVSRVSGGWKITKFGEIALGILQNSTKEIENLMNYRSSNANFFVASKRDSGLVAYTFSEAAKYMGYWEAVKYAIACDKESLLHKDFLKIHATKFEINVTTEDETWNFLIDRSGQILSPDGYGHYREFEAEKRVEKSQWSTAVNYHL